MARKDRVRAAFGWMFQAERPTPLAFPRRGAPPAISETARRLAAERATKRSQQYLGAAVSRLTRITAPNVSADKSTEQNIRELVKNSRDAVRNNGYAKRFLSMAKNNIVGPKGVAMRPVNAFGNGKPNDRLNDAITAAWAEWGRAKHASTNGRLSWLQIQRLLVSEWFTTGDGAAQIVLDPEHPFGMSLQPFDSDRIDRDFMRVAGPGQNEVRYGVEMDRDGRVLAYHVLKVHPSEIGWARVNSAYRDRIPADQIIHLYTQDERVDLTRGVPHLAIALRDFSHVWDAQDASLIALKVNAATPAFIETTGEGVEPDDPPDGDLQLSGEPGAYPYLGKGQHVNALDLNQPRDNFPDFVKAVLRGPSVGLGTSYTKLAKDWSDTSFSSSRMAHADDQDDWVALQEHFIEIVCRRVFEVWLYHAMLRGAIKVPDFDLSKANNVQWQGRRWVSPKPLEDIEVAEREVALGITSRSRIVAARGEVLWDVWQELREENEYAAENELNVEPPRKAQATTSTSSSMDERPPAGYMPDDMAKKPEPATERVLRLARSGV